jgi:hypothetical protein
LDSVHSPLRATPHPFVPNFVQAITDGTLLTALKTAGLTIDSIAEVAHAEVSEAMVGRSAGENAVAFSGCS